MTKGPSRLAAEVQQGPEHGHRAGGVTSPLRAQSELPAHPWKSPLTALPPRTPAQVKPHSTVVTEKQLAPSSIEDPPKIAEENLTPSSPTRNQERPRRAGRARQGGADVSIANIVEGSRIRKPAMKYAREYVVNMVQAMHHLVVTEPSRNTLD